MPRSAITLDPKDWKPASADWRTEQLKEGQRLGLWYGVWVIINVWPVEEVDLTDAQRRDLDRFTTREAKERHWPVRLRLAHESGPIPDFVRPHRLHDGRRVIGIYGGPLNGSGLSYHQLPERYQVCSCHGYPWPCQDVDRDEHTNMQMRELDTLTAKVPGACWGCNEPITTRQRSITYPGDNLDLPGGPPVRFHLRGTKGCWYAATRYEERWIALDPRNERILTWPSCGGILIVHGDGSSECRTSANYRSEPNCRGNDTHDHTTASACYSVGGDYVCPRSCPREGHPGCVPSSRPERQQPTLNLDAGQPS